MALQTQMYRVTRYSNCVKMYGALQRLMVRPSTGASWNNKLSYNGYSTDTTTPSASEAKPFKDIPGPNQSLLNLSYWWKDFRMFMHQGDKFYDMRFQQYPSGMFREGFGNENVVHLGNPHIIEEYVRQDDKHPLRARFENFLRYLEDKERKPGLVHLEGKEWHRTRHAMDHLMMRPRHVLEYTDTLNDVTTDFVNKLENLQQQQGPATPIPNMNKELWYWSLESIGALLYENRFGCFADKLDPKLETFVSAITDVIDTSLPLIVLPPNLAKYLAPITYKKNMSALDIVFGIGNEIMHEKLSEVNRKLANGETPSGFLSQLMSEKNLSDEEIHNNVFDLMFAAVDTTSNSMQWILYQLSRNQAVQDRVYEEVKDMQTDAGILDKSHVQHMHFVKTVIKETMRLYPAVFVYSRRSASDITLNGYRVPAGTLVLIATYATGRNPEYFPEPLEFKPERWLRENKQSINAFASLPFGFGPRMCIGRRIAELELQLLIAQLVQKFHILPGDPTPMLPKPRFLMHTDRPVSVVLKQRS